MSKQFVNKEERKFDPGTIMTILAVVGPILIEVGKWAIPLIIEWIKKRKDEKTGVVSFKSWI